MVVKPLHSVGKYGGTWRRAFTGPADAENGNRICSTDKILFWDYTATKVMPCVAKDWKVSDDGRVVVITLRKGHKWSDGQPFTADDFVFWHDDVYLNKDIQPAPHPDFMVNGKSGRLYKRDDYTVVFEFAEPNFLFVDILAGSTAVGGGQATQQFGGRTMGAYMPAHYLKQFLPKYGGGKEELDRKAKAAGYDGWLSYIKNRWDWHLNPELPVLTPWRTVSPANTPTWGLERNPYYYGVDTQGNQLPYIDRISMGLAENLEVVNLRAIAGQYDLRSGTPRSASCPSSSRTGPGGTTTSTSTRPSTGATPRSRSTTPTKRIRRSRSGCTPGTSAGRSRSESTATSSTRRSGWASVRPVPWPQPRACPTAPAPSGARSGPRTTPSRPTSSWTSWASPRRTARGTGCGPTARAGSGWRCRPWQAPSFRTPRSAR